MDIDFPRELLLSSFDAVSGFSAWISPDGGVIYVPPGCSHSDVIYEKPGAFGIKHEDIHNITPDRGDIEASLDVLYADLYKFGWIKVRNYGKRFEAVCDSVLKSLPRMRKWVNDVLSSDVLGESTEIGFVSHVNSHYEAISLGELLTVSIKGYIFDEKEMVSGGVWISPDGDIFGVPLTHIRTVVDDPARFGFTMEEIKSYYRRNQEGIGSEGTARDSIIDFLVSYGWVRIRFHPGDNIFQAELAKLWPCYEEYLSIWASKVLSKHPDWAGFPVVICEITEDRHETTFKLRDLVRYTLFEGVLSEY